MILPTPERGSEGAGAGRRVAGAALVVALLAAAVGFWVATGGDDDSQQIAVGGGDEPRVLVATLDGSIVVVAADSGEVRQHLLDVDLDTDATGPKGAVLGLSVDATSGALWWVAEDPDGPMLWRSPPSAGAGAVRRAAPVHAGAESVAATASGAVLVAPGDCAGPTCLHRIVDGDLSPATLNASAGRVPRPAGDVVVLAPASCLPAGGPDGTDTTSTTQLEVPDTTSTTRLEVPGTTSAADPVDAPAPAAAFDGGVPAAPVPDAGGSFIDVSFAGPGTTPDSGATGCPISQVAVFDGVQDPVPQRPLLPASPDGFPAWELWALSGSTGWAVSAPSGCGGPATVARVDLATGAVAADVALPDDLAALRPAGALGDGRVVLTAGHGRGVGCPGAPPVLALWNPASGEVAVLLDDVVAAAPWPSALDDAEVPPTTVTTTSSTTAPATTVPPTTGAPGDDDQDPGWETCSAEGLPVPPPQPGLPADIQGTRTQVLETAVACDATRMVTLLSRGSAFESSMPLPDDFAPLEVSGAQATVAWWQDREAAGEPVFAALVVTLSSGYFCDLAGFYDDPRCVWFSSSDDDPLPGHLHLASITPDGFAGWSEGYLAVSFVGSLLEGWYEDDLHGDAPPAGTVFVGPPRSERPGLPPGWPDRAVTESYVERLAALDPAAGAGLTDPTAACPPPSPWPTLPSSPFAEWECIRGR